MKSDIQISQECDKKSITEIAETLGITQDDIELYGKYKAKISDSLGERIRNNKDGKLILVTAINPTPMGEGKTTTTIGLGQAFSKLNKKAIIALREPSLGPCMGLKGGATGGGYAQIVPMEDINLHFTGDIHAITTAHNLLSAMIDNHIKFGNELAFDRVVWKRAVDLNDRALREITIGLGGEKNGTPREDGFMITVASEIMAIFCLTTDIFDLKKRLGKIIVGYTKTNRPIYARDLKANGAMTVILKDAIKPNLVQTLENTPAIVHGGPFANIAHGCNSIIATKTALKLADYVITEAGFGADLGAEKFFDIKCRKGNLKPDAVVLVGTIRAIKYNGNGEDFRALQMGIVNLEKHIENLQKYKLPVVVAINKFTTDTQEEIQFVTERCNKLGVECRLSEVWEKGGVGALDVASAVLELVDGKVSKFEVLYDQNETIENKIKMIAREIYGANGVEFTQEAKDSINIIEENHMDKVPICVAKTQYSFSDNPKLLGRPEDFTLKIREVYISNGAGFIVALAGNINIMPGLPKVPAAEKIDIDDMGNTVGLF